MIRSTQPLPPTNVFQRILDDAARVRAEQDQRTAAALARLQARSRSGK